MALQNSRFWQEFSQAEQDRLNRSFEINQHFIPLLELNLSNAEKLGIICSFIGDLSETQIAQLEQMIEGKHRLNRM